MAAGDDQQLIEIAAELVPLAADGCTIDIFDPTGVVCVAACHIDANAERELLRPEGRAAHTALSRCSITSDGETIGEVVTWGSRTLPPLGEAFVCSVAAHAGTLLELRRQRRHAYEAEAQLASVVAMVGHEVRAPLQALTVGVDLVQMRVRDSADHIPREWLTQRCEQLSQAVSRLTDVARRLLDASRLETVTHVEPVDEELGAIVDEVVSRLRDQAEWAGCSIAVERDGAQNGKWDRVHVETIVENLLTNAIKYGAGHGIEVTLAGTEHDVQLDVRDHGCGIVPEDLAHIFDRFYRGSVPGHHAGLGVGLWLVKKLTDAHGGTVACQSTPRDGTRFSVTLPRNVTRVDRARARSGLPREAPRR